ncbi:MAG: PA14 domain-containing protein, partial [Bacillota bacterium]
MHTTLRSGASRRNNGQKHSRRILQRACEQTLRFGLESLESRQLLSLPAGWLNQDVGTAGDPTGDPAIAGTSDYVDGKFIIQGSGSDIWNKADACQYAYRELDGDGEIIAYVEDFSGVTSADQNDWAKAGLMIRGSTDAGSPQIILATTDANTLQLQGRAAANADSWGVGLGAGLGRAGIWMKLARVGNTFTAYYSYDGSEWQPYADANYNPITRAQNMPNKVLVGLAVTAHDNARVDQATFANVAVNATPDTDEPGTPQSFVAGSTADEKGTLLTWVDNASNETGFVLERSTSPNFTNVTTVNLPADTTTYTDTNVTVGTTYYYRLKAVNGAGSSEEVTDFWTIGTHSGISIRYFNNTAQNWSGTPAAIVEGNIGINYGWGEASPATGVDLNFSTRFSGQILAPQTGTYTFIGRTDDMGYVYIDGTNVSYDNAGHGVQDATQLTTIDLEAGHWYTIIFDHCDTGGGAGAELDWIKPDGTRERIPAKYYTPKMATPAKATGLSAYDSGTQIDLSWDDQSVSELYYVVERSTDSAFTSPTTVGPNRPQNSTSATDVLIKPNTDYWYRVRAVNYDGESVSNVVHIKTSATTGTTGLIGTYYDGFNKALVSDGTLQLQRNDAQIDSNYGDNNSPAEGVAADNFFIRWEGNVTPLESGEYVFGTSSDDGCRLWVNGELVTNGWYPRGQNETAPQEIPFHTLNLVAGQSYSFVYEMYDSGGGAGAHVFWQRVGAAWDGATAWTKIPAEVFSPVHSAPAAATNLTTVTTPGGAPSVNISWTDNAINETSTRIEMSTDGGQTWTTARTLLDHDGGDNGMPSLVSNPNGAAVQTPAYTIDFLAPNTAYKFRVVEHNAWGETISASIDVTTPAAIVAPAVSNLTVTSFGKDNVSLKWTDNSLNETGFRIERSLDGQTNWTAVTTTNRNVTSFTDTGLTSSTTYYYRVVATNAAGDAVVSNIVNVGTMGETLPASWEQVDIGIGTGTDVGKAATNPSASVWQLTGGGNDIWGAADELHYAYMKVSGDFRMTARITGMENTTDGWAKSGVMVRETLD